MNCVFLKFQLNLVNIVLLFIIFSVPPTALTAGINYSLLAGAFKTDGYSARSPKELSDVLKRVFASGITRNKPVIINVEVSPYSSKKPQV